MPHAWHLKSRPNGLPTDDNFEFREINLPALEDGQVHVRNDWLSVDPYMRGRMNDVKSYVPPFQIGEPLEGGAVGVVVESRSPDFQPGDHVLHMLGWRDEAVVPAAALNKLPQIPGVEPKAFLGNLGLTGGTAYWGLLDAAKAKAGDIVFVSAAAGAVGSAVVQIARAKGMTVIGSAGGPDKVEFVRSLGADACIDYKSGTPLVKALSEVAPKGIDVYFDNVGGEHLDAALALARKDARFAICGMIDGYNSGAPTQLRYIMRLIAMRILLKGFIYTDYLPRNNEFYGEMGPWVASGKVEGRETVVEGLEKTPEAFLGLFSGANTGKMLVKVER
jgi:NADPH-dependent curcumin reductase CurA